MRNTFDFPATRRAHLLAAAVVAVSGCAQTTPHWDASFGKTVNLAVAQQTRNPDASKNTDPVSGVDGPAAHQAMERYQKSFGKPEPQPNVFRIGVSGAR